MWSYIRQFFTIPLAGQYQRLRSSQNEGRQARKAATAARAGGGREDQGRAGAKGWRQPERRERMPATDGGQDSGQDGGQNESVFFHRKFFLPVLELKCFVVKFWGLFL